MSKYVKTGRLRFATRLGENIKKHSKLLVKPGGNITMAKINYDFAVELTEIFNETIVEMLLEEGKVNFDQFGKFEVKTYEGKRLNNPFTGYKDYIVPAYQVIRFCPAARLKLRVKGEAEGRTKKVYGFQKKKIIESEETEDGN